MVKSSDIHQMDQFLFSVISVLLLHMNINNSTGVGRKTVKPQPQVTRAKQDVFANPDSQCKSDFCVRNNSRGAVFAHCATSSCCRCQCNYGTPTYIHSRHQCMKSADIYKLLPVNYSGVDYLADITHTGSHCHSTSLPLIDIGVSSRRRLYTCHQHMQNQVVSLSSSISKCKLFPNNTLRFRNGFWRPFPKKYGAIDVSLQRNKTTNKLFIYFKWQHDTGQMNSGRIFFLKITCQSVSNASNGLTVGFLFKTGNEESSSKTTAAPAITAILPSKTNTTPISVTTQFNSSLSYNLTAQPTEKTVFYRPTLTSSYLTVIIATKVKVNNKTDHEEKDAGNGKSQNAHSRDVIIIAAASAVGLVLGLISGILVQTIVKKRSKSPLNESSPLPNSKDPLGNPVYDRRPDSTILIEISEESKPNEETENTYQPLIENTRIKQEHSDLHQDESATYEALRRITSERESIGHRQQRETEETSDDPYYQVLEVTECTPTSNSLQQEEPIYSYIMDPWEQRPEPDELSQGSVDSLQDRRERSAAFYTQEEEEERNYVEVAI